MALVKKSITITDRQEQWIRAQVASGDYGSDSEYFRTLIRQDQERNATFRALKEAVQEGVESGVSDRTVKEIWAEAEQRYETRNG
ncbi:MAG: type II toxin-antitoxin system ParD family antitoxin [Acidobacteria bacterium]|nr:type II toxin-antitoxin system ParD family antitoxin [Acidobacteriota bacterium]